MKAEHVHQFADTALQFVELASFVVKRGCDELIVHRGLQKKASDLAPETLETLVKTGAVREEQRQAAAAMLGSHAETLQLLKWAAEELYKARTAKNAGALGEPVDDPERNGHGKNGYDSLADPFVCRPTSQKKASDIAILKVLDDPRP